MGHEQRIAVFVYVIIRDATLSQRFVQQTQYMNDCVDAMWQGISDLCRVLLAVFLTYIHGKNTQNLRL